jgi:hypothetical protein
LREAKCSGVRFCGDDGRHGGKRSTEEVRESRGDMRVEWGTS